MANHLFEKSGNATEYADFKNDLPRLVAKFDKDSNFTRKWVNNQMIQYFTDFQNYTNLDTHKKLFQNSWKSIFTTNYDLCMEYAENNLKSQSYRLFTIADSKESASILGEQKGKLKYFKIHGCCHELEQHLESSPPLVITQTDFRNSIARNQTFFEELRRCAYNGSIIFIGFQAQRAENNPILATIIDTYNALANSFHEPFTAFSVLKDVSQNDRFDIEEAGLTLLEGTFQEFIELVNTLQKETKITQNAEDIDQKIWVKVAEKEVGLTIGEHKQFSSQFTFYYENYLEDEAKKIEGIQNNHLIDMWKADPSDAILSKGYYINRVFFNDAKEKLKCVIADVSKDRSSKLLIITGKRASGKSVLSRQLMGHAYSDLHQPALILSQQSSYGEKQSGLENVINISGWDGKQIDKFLSLFSTDNEDERSEIIPVILADHILHRTNALDHLLSYLENHGKPCVLILTLNQDEFEMLKMPESLDRLLQLYEYQNISIPHKLNDQEIGDLFNVVSKLEPKIQDKRDLLINKATSTDFCNRDILLILHTWFDRQFRRLDEIIADEIETLKTLPRIKDFYLSVAVFHQYNFSPQMSICAESSGVSMDAFYNLRSSPIFKALIENRIDAGVELASTRHSEFSRRILEKLIPESDKQVNLMCRILSLCGPAELQFARDFLLYICRYGALLTVEQVIRIKDATEMKLSNDYVLNHQFGAYLIREGTKLDDARYYLDLASDENPSNSSIIHSIGNLCYKLYKNKIAIEPEKAIQYYDLAKNHFAKNRTLANSREEYAYFTEISMIHHRINNSLDDEATKALLNAEKNALTFEALRVVPSERQNLLKISIDREVPFNKLPNTSQKIIMSNIKEGEASHVLLDYYARSLYFRPNKEKWEQLSELVSLYWESAKKDPSIAIIVCEISKHAYIKNAKTRFELLRGFFDKLIRYQETKINFFLLARYTRLIQIDALVLEKYDFLRTTSGDVINIFRDSKPKFLDDEFILSTEYYCFEEDDITTMIYNFERPPDCSISKNAERYHSMVNLDSFEGQNLFRVELDPISHYFIRGVRKEVAVRGRVDLNFCIKHKYDGFWATDFRT